MEEFVKKYSGLTIFSFILSMLIFILFVYTFNLDSIMNEVINCWSGDMSSFDGQQPICSYNDKESLRTFMHSIQRLF